MAAPAQMPLSPAQTLLSLPPDDYRRSLCKRSFEYFVKLFWEEVPGAGKLIWNWHMSQLCHELEVIAQRVAKRLPNDYDLVVNISPGTSKSTLASILFTPWTWTFFPQARHLTASHTDTLVLDLANKSRQVIEGELYQRLFPHVKLHHDQNTKSYFRNTLGGDRLTCTVAGKSPTGFHAHFLVVDDPLDPKKAVSEVELKNAKEFIANVLPTRKTDKTVSTTFLIMQRLHNEDPTAVMLDIAKHEEAIPVRHICLPAEVGDNIHPPELAAYYEQGLMDPKRLPLRVLRDFKIRLGPYGYAGQFAQRPVPAEGGMFKEAWFSINRPLPAAPYQAKRVRFWDLAASQAAGDYTTGTLMAYLDGMFYVEHVHRGRWGPDERDREIRAMAQRDARRYGPNFAPTIWIEDQGAAAGKTLHQYLSRLLVGFPVFSAKPLGSKEVRAEPFAGQAAAGNVTLIDDSTSERPCSWDIAAWLFELTAFPLGAHDDQVDSGSGAVGVLSSQRPAGSVRFLHYGQTKREQQLRFVVCTKDELANLIIDEHRCLLVCLSDPSTSAQDGRTPAHGLSKLLDTLALSFADLEPSAYLSRWQEPISPWQLPPEELLMKPEDGKKLWSLLTKTREERIEVVVFQDEGDQRAKSVAYAVCDQLHLKRSQALHILADPESNHDEPAPNTYVYEQTKASRSLVL